ncbi:MAG: chloride channel protein [Sorangiineae bacterium]|nr:chloride channel protein [Polyangiaceae bacterium]MEB2323990.1 chloride channel protein [Sorangiineae bacterium]
MTLRRLATALRKSARATPLELGLLGRTLLHAALVGAASGLIGSFFFWALGFTERMALEHLAGYRPLRAAGEGMLIDDGNTPFRPWLLWALPAVGALLGGILSFRWAPETQGGGADAIIASFHQENATVRRRVFGIKTIASVLTLGFGGSGGREGPTMQIGGAIGSMVARVLKVSARERRILLVAGLAGSMSAVFRAPLGAALLAVEVMYTNDFESDALVPSVLASVVAYSVFISFFGESTLFSHAAHYPFIPAQLPLYGLLALFVSLAGIFFLWTLRGVRRLTLRVPLPGWARPALGGLALGGLVVPLLLVFGPRVGGPGQGLGILGGGYGAAQLAISGASWLADGWHGAGLLLLLGVLKIVGTSLTIGSGGSAGDFGPSLVIGGLLGGAFGRAAELLLHDPRIDPGAFAMVGMGIFYGGLAHVPIASMVMVCELAGSYELLVPLMLAEGVVFVLLRHRRLYESQVDTKRDSPAHRGDLVFDVLKEVRIKDVMIAGRPFRSFYRRTPASEVIREIGASEWQDAFPVHDADGRLVGVVSADVLRALSADPELAALTLADDLMTAPVAARLDDDLHTALEVLLEHGVREVLVTDATGKIVGFLDESEITNAYLGATTRPE